MTFEFRFPQSETIKPYSRYRWVGLWDVSPLTGEGYDRVWERMRGLPGVLSAAGINRPPLNGPGLSMAFLIEGRPALAEQRFRRRLSGTGPDRGLLRGHAQLFRNHENSYSAGQGFHRARHGHRPTRGDRLQKKEAPVLYVPHRQQTPRWLGPYWNDRAAMTFVLQATGDPQSLIPAVRHAVGEIDPNKPAAEFRTVEE